ncbi:MAG: V-type ATP synthase subunit E [Candidatus Limivicinus sp.]|nr:V-type ATP synthase subunit E [Clostridiales bacterium]MDY3860153.1 V-type ATP synthase subunit E [Candidatus Limivicinus sp.]
MKGTEKIIAHIQADAKAQADAILAQAEQQCAEIRQNYEIKARDAYGEKIRVGVKANQDKLDSIDRLARMEGRKSVLALKQEMVSASFDRACEMLVSLPGDKYVELLAKLAAQASVSGDEELVLNERDRAGIGEAVVKAANEKLGGGKLTLAGETGDFKGGLILRRGSIEANCTVELLVELCRGEMSAQLAKVLFE